MLSVIGLIYTIERGWTEMTLIFDPVDRFTWLLTTFLTFICGFIFITHGEKRDHKNEKLMMFGFAGYFFGLGGDRLLSYFSEFFI